MKNTTIAAAALALLLPLAANAATPSYNYLDLSYSKQSEDGLSGGKGYLLGGSYAIAENWFLGASYGHNSFDSNGFGGLFTQSYTVFGGLRLPITDAVDFVGRLGYANDHVKNGDVTMFGITVPGGSDTKSGYTLGVGIRAMVLDQLELNAFVDHDNAGAVSHDHVNNTETVGSVGALYRFSPSYGLGLSYRHSNQDGTNLWLLTGRWYF